VIGACRFRDPSGPGFPGCDLRGLQRRHGPPAPRSTPLRADAGAFRRSDGRWWILRGVNARVKAVFDVTFDDGRQPLEEIPDFTVDDARWARQLGFNLLRLPIN